MAYSLLALSAAMPAAALAASGPGGSAAPAPASASAPARTASPTAGTPPVVANVQSAVQTVSTTGDGVTLQTTASAMIRKQILFSGSAPQNLAGETVEIQRASGGATAGWTTVASAGVASNGSFLAGWQATRTGHLAIRAVVVAPDTAQAASATEPLTLTVYAQSVATQYGPGFYGHLTACGEKLRPSTIGVASRTLKCGTPVAVYYGGRMLVVPVIDRGPYARGVTWDLTEATGQALGILGTARIGAVPGS